MAKFYMNGVEIDQQTAVNLLAASILQNKHDSNLATNLWIRTLQGSQFAADDLAVYVDGLEIITLNWDKE